MSDFDLKKPEEIVRELVQSRIPSEDKAWLFLKLFVRLKPNEKLPSTWSQRKQRIEANTPWWNDSLKWAALHWRKDQRTIRRWCENGIFRHAYRTKGGHWRIPYKEVECVDLNRLAKCFRHPKRINQSKLFKSLDEVFRKTWITAKQAQLLEEIKRRITGTATQDQHVTDEALMFSLENPEAIRVKSHARQLSLNKGHVTAAILAKALKISRATLYRRYGTKMIRYAIQKARVKISVAIPNKTEADSLAQQVAEIFKNAAHLHEPGEHRTRSS